MKKVKFLSFAALAACFAMTLASCEKENFTTDVEAPSVNVPTITIPGITLPEGYQPGQAVIAIQPTVIGFINGETKTITDECTITYNGESEFKYEPNSEKGIDPTEVAIKAEYVYQLEELSNTFSVEQTIKIPALSAGMIAVVTPTLILTAEGEVSGMGIETVKWENLTEGKTITLKNDDPYHYTDWTVYPNIEVGSKVTAEEIAPEFVNNILVNRWIEAHNDVWNWGDVFPLVVDYIPADASVIIPYTIEGDTTDYKIVKKAEWSDGSTTEVVAATFTVRSIYTVKIDAANATFTESTNSHGGHGHGHGNDNANAGGGIYWDE